MLFKKNEQQNTEQNAQNSNALLIAKLRRQMHMQLAVIACCVGVLSISTYAFITRAWFSNNREVDQSNTSITSDSPSPSLYIRPGLSADNSNADYSNTVGVSVNEDTAKLFPISTADCDNWYYVSKFSFQQVSSGGITVSVPKASEYTKSNPITRTAIISPALYYGAYNNTYEGNVEKTAFIVQKTNIYTTNGEMQVYLDPDAPITVSLKSAESKPAFLNAVRVGIKTPGGIIIYSPSTAAGTGNSSGATADTFEFVSSSATTVGAISTATGSIVTSSNISNYQAEHDPAKGEGFYKVTGGQSSLGTATALTDGAGGLDVEVFVWLEGTDADAVVGQADNDSAGLDIVVRYVGVVDGE